MEIYIWPMREKIGKVHPDMVLMCGALNTGPLKIILRFLKI